MFGMTITQLYYFLSVAKNLSFTKAAQEHFVAQTAISQQIAALERELGVILFNRSTRSVTLTKAGTSFYADTEKIIAQMEEATFRAQHYHLGNSGFLNLGFPGKYGMGFLVDVLKEFREHYPDVGVNLHIEMNTVLQSRLCQGDLDVVFTFCKSPAPLLQDGYAHWMELGCFPLCVVLPSNHPLADRTSVTWEEIKYERLVSGPQYGSNSRFIYNVMQEESMDRVATSLLTDRQVYSDDALMLLVEAGYGCGILPSFVSSQYEKKPRFIRIEGSENGPHLMLGWRKDGTNPVALRFVETYQALQDKSPVTFS